MPTRAATRPLVYYEELIERHIERAGSTAILKERRALAEYIHSLAQDVCDDCPLMCSLDLVSLKSIYHAALDPIEALRVFGLHTVRKIEILADENGVLRERIADLVKLAAELQDGAAALQGDARGTP